MTVTAPTAAASYNAVAWNDPDDVLVENFLTGLTDGNTITGVVAQGADPDDILKVTFPSKATVKAGDTISVWVTSLSAYVTMALLPYNGGSTVKTANKITLTAATGVNVFTLTQAFIDDLYGPTGKWSVRIVEDGEIAGSATISEISSDLNLGGGGEPTSPGSDSGNAPAGYAYLKDARLTRHSSYSRMPQTQREWNAFIQELNKWIKNETGTFDVGDTATAQFTGFSADPAAASIWWHRYGQIVHLEFNISTGTSDATDFTITGIPEVIRPRDDSVYPLFGLYDNGAALPDGSVKIGSDGTLTFYSDQADGAWTGSGTKGFTAGLAPKSLIYSLRNPVKL